MGIIKGYICSSCNFEKNYFLGSGFSNQKETTLFECSYCNAIKKSTLSSPKCSKCNRKSLNEIMDFTKKLECPRCKRREFNFEIEGSWD